MDTAVVVEPVKGNGYRATGAGGLSVGLSAEGDTAEEAVDRLALQVHARVNAGAKLAELNVASNTAPWQDDAGWLEGDPLFDRWVEAMQEYRRKLDEEAEAL